MEGFVVRRIWIIVVVLVLVGSGVIVWSLTRQEGKTTPTFSGTSEKIRIANIGIFSIFNLVAEEKGFFAANGLDAEISEYDSGATSIAALLSGKVDVAIAADFVGVANLFNHEDIRVLARVSDHDVFRLIARLNAGINEPSDLKGKRIGVTRQTAGEFYLGRFLTVNGLTINDVTLVDLAPAAMIEQIESGELDAILIYEPQAYAAQVKLGSEAITWSAQGDQRAFGLVYGLRSLTEKRPEVIERYLRALTQAETYVHEHGNETRTFIGRVLEYDDAYLNQLWPNFSFAIGLDKDMLLNMEDQARWMIRNGLTQKNSVPNYLDAIYFSGLESVKPESVTLVH